MAVGDILPIHSNGQLYLFRITAIHSFSFKTIYDVVRIS